MVCSWFHIFLRESALSSQTEEESHDPFNNAGLFYACNSPQDWTLSILCNSDWNCDPVVSQRG